jgi:hypothetical protein
VTPTPTGRPKIQTLMLGAGRRLVRQLPLVMLVLLAAWPLLIYGAPTKPPVVSDGINHRLRFEQLEWHIQHGDFYPRWFSDLHFGFGAPVLNFYAPLSYYILVGLHLLGASQAATFMLGFVLALAVAIWGTYLWVRDQFASPVAGFVAAAAYGLSPYLIYDILDRAAYPEVWGLAIAPWLFWLVYRCTRSSPLPARWLRLALPLAFAAIILSHNLSALIMTPLVVCYAAAVMIASGGPIFSRLVKLGLRLAQGAGLAAFFWLPFAMESAAVQLNRATRYDYHTSFLTLANLLELPKAYDALNVSQDHTIGLSWLAVGLPLLAIGLCLWKRPPRLWQITMATLGLLALTLIFLVLPSSALVWSLIPGMSFIQFPWRLLGPINLLLAWFCGAAIAAWPSPKTKPALAGLALAGFFFFSLASTYHLPYRPLADLLRPLDIIQIEIADPMTVGSTASLEFVPRWVREMPPATTLVSRYTNTPLPSKLEPLPVGVEVLAEQPGIKSQQVNYRATAPFTATFDIFFFPGWAATLDGRPVSVKASSPHGLITAQNLPAGQHTLALALTPTGPQIIGTLVSLLSLAALALWWRRPVFQPSAANQAAVFSMAGLSPWLSLVPLGLLVLRVALLDHIETPFRNSPLQHVSQPLSVNYDDQIELIGLDLKNPSPVGADQPLRAVLYWRARTPLTVNYHTLIQLVDDYGQRFGQVDHYNPGTVPSSFWSPDQYALDEFVMTPAVGTPPGTYHLYAGAYALTAEGGVALLNVRGEAGPIGAYYDLGTIILGPASPQPSAKLHKVEGALEVSSAMVGDQISIPVVWHSGDAALPSLQAAIKLTAPDGRLLLTTMVPPARPDFPTDQWPRNRLIRYRLSFILPPDLAAGPTQASIQLYDAAGTSFTPAYDLGELTLQVPARTFTLPPLDYRVDYALNDAVLLRGYELTPETITLYWQATQVISQPLTVFVHRFNADDSFTGHDAPPDRPTTSWLPGEIISDTHPLAVGNHFEVGLYNPQTGERFGTPFVAQP